MKKVILFVAAVFVAFSSFAGGNGVKALKKKGEGVLSNGFYLNLGLAFPSAISTINFNGGNFTGSSQNLGLQPSLEIGNQWYFWHNKRFGVGLKVSWFQFGYSVPQISSSNYSSVATNYTNNDLDIRLLKVAPQISFGITKELAIDLSFEVSPTLNLNIVYFKDANALDNVLSNYNYGALFAPGIRFRYRVFAAGFDYSLGTLNYKGTTEINNVKQPDVNGTSTFALPRIYLGFQF